MMTTSSTSRATNHNDNQHHHRHLRLVAALRGAKGGMLTQVVDDRGVVNGRLVNGTVSVLLGRAVPGPALLGPGALADAEGACMACFDRSRRHPRRRRGFDPEQCVAAGRFVCPPCTRNRLRACSGQGWAGADGEDARCECVRRQRTAQCSRSLSASRARSGARVRSEMGGPKRIETA
jgi:hypothetical protein